MVFALVVYTTTVVNYKNSHELIVFSEKED